MEVSESPVTEVITVEEQAELDKINKLLNKAQGARNAHKKMVRPNKKLNCFSGTASSVLKVPHYVFLLLSKINEIKTTFPVRNIVIGNSHAVPLGSCGPLQVMFGCLIILAIISG